MVMALMSSIHATLWMRYINITCVRFPCILIYVNDVIVWFQYTFIQKTKNSKKCDNEKLYHEMENSEGILIRD